MRQAALDRMIDFAVEELASGDGRRAGALVRRLVERHPAEPALSICFALTSAAARMEDVLDGDATLAVDRAYRMAALLAADIHALEALGQCPASATDLLHFWRRVDPYFLML